MKFLKISIICLTLVTSTFAKADTVDDHAAFFTSVAGGATTTVAMLETAPYLAIPLVTTSVVAVCSLALDEKTFYDCLTLFVIDFMFRYATYVAIDYTFNHQRYAVMNEIQADLMNVIAGDEAKYPLVQSLIQVESERQQQLHPEVTIKQKKLAQTVLRNFMLNNEAFAN